MTIGVLPYSPAISVSRGSAPWLYTHDGGGPLRLEPFQAHAFDGGAATVSTGRCRDFNLMLRKGRCRGTLRPLRFSGAGAKAIK